MSEILLVDDISVEFDGFTVLDHLDLSIHAGELRFLIGPNGAGKTTLLDIVTGRIRPRSGRVLFGASDISRWSEHRRVRAGIGRKFQTPSIFPSLSVAENMEVALGCTEGTLRLLRQLAPHQRDRIDEVLTLVGLVDRRGLRAGALAHGEMQWLEIGMLLVQNPQLLLLDEPIAGMTRDERDRTGQLLQALARTHSIVVVEHDMEFMRQFAREVTVLHLGRVLMHGDVEAVQEDARVREIYLGPKRESVPVRPTLVAVGG